MNPQQARQILSVMRTVEKMHGIQWAEIINGGRRAPVVVARHLAAITLITRFGWKFQQTAKTIGWKHHSSVTHAIQRMQDEAEIYPEASAQMNNFYNEAIAQLGQIKHNPEQK